ncbi:putative ribosome biogenesis GTPase RsgA [Clostridium pasteurianum DSM 525 = ATCC 6013]|uniref:Small ribosomal subunit biogenesis GTPase RsgA n=1 Tax=Clostridium pasteurianum DSM 525 = ATCC 6013 TaxID=1262449 RepID=A0A0H3J8D4_CLOPA|nr:ribosome small subunit-dependent GTPase A [Clostridium pasteurianum]AJA48168.1 putative ribosome biogenesis GTPase RsgA [Clostridium pasteurianum DSM 525 = ATCC 6013]AJA52156.1 putative ribosome biogenesis GTPase RsgA [Clostridium pasteurianum DSM 525 = ATCC 6013]AOZ75428.1 ribosome biogenesis GTPase RsgA [Clostridium pasteurianum DSM 525 = ATCC 6013]AOZ79223.1 ribosome biogenesis GTPase RsgA [Clostridium pasteurianum]ELP60680.1 GTPase RsgA [Clostridium pasteurianum DSM 525 = ATCC 6013]
MQGIIIKGIGGFYYVKVNSKIYECKARGKFRHKELSPLVGDNVIIDLDEDNKGVIKEICDRTSKLIRPSIANVTQAFIIFAVRNPDFNMDLLNKFLVLCEVNKLKAVVCFNKIDLATKEEVDNTVSLVKSIGYETIYLNAKTGYGIDKIKAHLEENITVFCGPSGVGKSTILNSIVGHSAMETGDISKRLNRGKHTTRHCELLEIDGGYVADSPGFSSLDISFIKKDQLQGCFPEFLEYYDTCKFSTCMHYKEPGCTVKEAVESGKINKNRYMFYIKTLEEILSRREWK